jgi:hypothetical protein
MQGLLNDTGSSNTERFKAKLTGHQFSLDLRSSAYAITPFGLAIDESGPYAGTNDDRRLSWWRPVASHWAMRSVTLGLPIALTTILEFLQRINDKNQGIASIGQGNNVATLVFTRFIPASVMVLVASLFNSLDFTLSALAPFYSMKRDWQPAKRGIRSSVLGKTPLTALYFSIKNRHYLLIHWVVAQLSPRNRRHLLIRCEHQLLLQLSAVSRPMGGLEMTLYLLRPGRVVFCRPFRSGIEPPVGNGAA